MKNAILALATGIALALTASSVSAGATNDSTLHDRLTQHEGLSLVSDGLYAETTENGESYVATNAAGRAALAQKMRAIQPRLNKLFQAGGISRSERALLGSISKKAQELQSPVAKASQERTGFCSGGAQLYARATANAGTSANGYAVVSLDFSPVTPTLNEVNVGTDFNGAYDSGSGYDAASAAVSDAASCFSNANASVTCPGAAAPAVDAWAFSFNRAPRCRL